MISNDFTCVFLPFFLRFIEALEDVVDSPHEVKNGGGLGLLWWQRRDFWLGTLSQKTLFALPLHPLEVIGRILEFAILDQLPNEIPPGIVVLILIFNDDLLVDWEQFLALDVHERGGHHDKLARQVQVEALHQLHVLAELIGNLHHVDLVDIDLLLAYQMKEQIQRPLKHFKLETQFRHLPGANELRTGTIWFTTRRFQSAKVSAVFSTP